MNAFPTLAHTYLSRRAMLKLAGVTAGFSLAQIEFLRSAAAQSDDVQRVLDITATTERFGVTFLGMGLESAMAGNFDQPWPADVVAVVTAARAQEADHLAAFEQAGGQALVDTFTVPPETLTNFTAFFTAVVDQETAETAAQIAAMRVFTEMNRPDLAKISFQYAAEESEHRLLANYTRGVRPANDLALIPVLFETVEDFLTSLETRGIIGGTGTAIVYPGPGEIDASNVIEREPGGIVVDCVPSSLPNATPNATPNASPVATPIG